MKGIKTCDILIWTAFVLMLLVKFSTIFIFMQLQETTQADIEQIATAYEGNDLFKIAFSLKKIGYILTIMIIPGAAMATYYFMRRRVMQGKADIETLTYFTQFAFFALLCNLVNDGASLLSLLVELI